MNEPLDRRAGVDCAMFVADWVKACTGIDPAADLRGAYVGAAGATRLIRAWGGFEIMWRVHMAVAGFVETRHPAEGDVGIVLDRAGHVGAAIRVHGAWAAKTALGLVIEDFEMRVAWSIPSA